MNNTVVTTIKVFKGIDKCRTCNILASKGASYKEANSCLKYIFDTRLTKTVMGAIKISTNYIYLCIKNYLKYIWRQKGVL